jgi:hypothetical protein
MLPTDRRPAGPRRGPRAFVGAVVVALACLGAVRPGVADPPDYPRLANAYWATYVDSAVVQAVAQWDVAVLNSIWTGAQLQQLRALNPDIRIFFYVNPYSVNLPPTPNTWLLENYQYAAENDLWWYDRNGGIGSDWPATYMANITGLGPVGPLGRWKDYMALRVEQLMAAHPELDGVFYDNYWKQLSWQQWVRQLDSDCNPTHNPAGCDGVADSNARLDSLWNAALWDLAAATRQRFDALEVGRARPLAVLTNNAADYFPYLNGTMHEFFPSGHSNVDYDNGYGYNWYEEMMACPHGYLEAPFSTDPYDITIMNADYYGYMWTPARNAEFERHKRFTLGSTLLGDGYYSLDAGLAGHSNLWWEAEYDHAGRGKGYLGQPLGPLQRLLPASGDEQLVNGSFSAGKAGWFGFPFGAVGSWSIDSTQVHTPPAAVRFDVQSVAPAGHYKLWQAPVPLVHHQAYTLRFWARASIEQQLTVHLYSDSCSGTRCLDDRSLCVGSEWRQFEMSFRSKGTVGAGLNFFVSAPGTLWLDDVSLTLGDTGLFRRDFDDGIVLVNYTNQVQQVELETTYYQLRIPGSMTFDGSAVTSVAVPGSDARILVRQQPVESGGEPSDAPPSGRARATLEQNEPNPFNPSTRLRFTLEHPEHARLAIHDVAGRLVRVLVDADLRAGRHEVRWDGRDAGGTAMASGIYLVRLLTPSGSQTRKMALVQ